MSGNGRHVGVMVYVGAVVTASAAVLATAVQKIDRAHPIGLSPMIFWFFALFLIAGELWPMEWLPGRNEGHVTASWTFIIGMVCMASSGVALAVIALIGGVIEARNTKKLHRLFFNAGQMIISLGAAAAVLNGLGGREPLWASGGPPLSWVGATLVAGLVALAVNTLLTCIAISLSTGQTPLKIAREAFTAMVAFDLLSIGMAPVLLVVAVRSPVVIPILLAVLGGAFVGAKMGFSDRHEATHDPLTGLPNRRMFFRQAEAALKAAEARGRMVAVLLIDLDGFKEINDRLGHGVGDLALQHVSKQLQTHCRSSDLVARLGGDEFVVLLAGAIDADAAKEVAAALLRAIRVPLLVDGVPLNAAGSLGLALYPDHGAEIDVLLGHADSAMYQAKTTQAGVRVFEDGLGRAGTSRTGILGELRHAISSGEQLFLMYQPKIDLRNDTMCGVEALIRWNHPTRGVLTAEHFMPAAEQTDLMDVLTLRVLRESLRQASSWLQRGITIPVAVNVSAHNLTKFSFPEDVAEIIREFAFPPHLLELEITENTVTADPIRAEVILAKLKSLGLRISVDDFGTGYSSLAHLRDLSLDSIKIDRSFVKDLCTTRSDQVIVRCILDLATNLGLSSVAEGVEDAETLALLREMGCDVAQGYYLGMPTDAADVERQLLARQLFTGIAGDDELVRTTP